MQVALQTTLGTGLNPSPLKGGSVARPNKVATPSPVSPKQVNEFPDHPLISTRPVRYNVLLNEQLTAVQRADNFLRSTESQLLQLRQAASGGSAAKYFPQSAQQMTELLSQRSTLSGNTVDRQLQVSLEGKTQVQFVLPDAQSILQRKEEETLIFALAGNKRELAAVRIDADSSPEQALYRLNQGLGRWGVHGRLDDAGRVKFQVSESRWQAISSQLSVRGEGVRFPADQFFPLQPLPEPAAAERVQEVASQPRRLKGNQSELDKMLENVTQQRRRLTQNKDKVRQRIESMATFSEQGAAQQAAQQVGKSLSQANESYSALSQALSAQANVHPRTVINLLS